jgi:hypothetical protein
VGARRCGASPERCSRASLRDDERVSFLTLNEKRQAVGYAPVEEPVATVAPENDETVVIRKLVLPEAGKYRADQARAPRGQSDGGQWVMFGGTTPMVEFRMDKDDAILPTRIVHNSEQIWHRPATSNPQWVTPR